MVLFVFGLCGVGKTYVGKKIATHFGIDYVDGDDCIPAKMSSQIDNQEPITPDALAEYMQVLEERVKQLVDAKRPVVITQALYRNTYREHYSSCFPSVHFIEVTAQDEVCYGRVKDRDNWVKEPAARDMRQYYEDPKTASNFVYTCINNNLDADLDAQIEALRELVFPSASPTAAHSATENEPVVAVAAPLSSQSIFRAPEEESAAKTRPETKSLSMG